MENYCNPCSPVYTQSAYDCNSNFGSSETSNYSFIDVPRNNDCNDDAAFNRALMESNMTNARQVSPTNMGAGSQVFFDYFNN